MRRCLRFLMVAVLVLAGCRRGQPADTPTPPPPTAAPTVAPEKLEAITRGYTSLVLIEGSVAALDALAERLQQDSSADATAALNGINTVLGEVNAALSQPSPVSELSTTWGEARQILPAVTSVIRRWLGSEITAATAPAALATARNLIGPLVERAATALGQAYGLDTAALQAIKDQALAQLQATVEAAPTAQP